MNKLCAKTSPYLRARINADQPPLRLRLAARYPNNRKSSILSRLLLFAVSIAIFLPIDRNDSNPAECRIVEFSLNRSNRGNWKKRNDYKIFSILFHRNFTLVVRIVSRNISQIVPDKGDQEEKGRRTFVRFLARDRGELWTAMQRNAW